LSDDPIERIRLRSHDLPPSLQRVAAVVARDPAGTAYLSGPALAARVEVSQPTVVRFAQALGYEGYPDFLQALRQWVTSRPTIERMQGTSSHSEVAVWRSVMETDIRNIASTMAELNDAQFQRVVELIASARRIYVWGVRTANTVAAYLLSSLSFLYETERVIQLTQAMYLEQLLTADDRDVGIFVSFPRYPRVSIEAAQYARERGIHVVALTDSAVSPLAAHAEHALFAQSQLRSFMESFVAPLSVAQALITTLAVADGERTVERLQMLEEEWATHGTYHSPHRASAALQVPRRGRPTGRRKDARRT
jgi:DNA-binding MurR/RpiR family transcriptional regulator